MSTTDSRAAFEKWAQKEGYNVSPQMETGRYWDSHVEARWQSWQAATEAAKATGTAEPPLLPVDTGLLRLAESWAYDFALGQSSPMERQRKWQMVQNKIADQMREYGQACAEAARHDKDGNHADDLRAWLDEARDEIEVQGAALHATSLDLKAAEAELAARQPAPVMAVKTWQERMGKSGPPITAMQAEIAELRAALAAIAAPVSVSERDMAIAQAVRQACVNSYSPDDSASDYAEKMGDIDLATIIRAATNRSQP